MPQGVPVTTDAEPDDSTMIMSRRSDADAVGIATLAAVTAVTMPPIATLPALTATFIDGVASAVTTQPETMPVLKFSSMN